jgi:hypothetical protein
MKTAISILLCALGLTLVHGDDFQGATHKVEYEQSRSTCQNIGVGTRSQAGPPQFTAPRVSLASHIASGPGRRVDKKTKPRRFLTDLLF